MRDRELWKIVEAQFALGRHSIHGPDHWRRVEDFGLRVAASSGADLRVVRLFAVFHDACRRSDDWDPAHGPRGGDLAQRLRGRGTSLDELDDHGFDLLLQACRGHTGGRTTTDPTVGTCWDADRLDLPRAFIWPSAAYLSTVAARDLINGDYHWAHYRSRCT